MVLMMVILLSWLFLLDRQVDRLEAEVERLKAQQQRTQPPTQDSGNSAENEPMAKRA